MKKLLDNLLLIATFLWYEVECKCWLMVTLHSTAFSVYKEMLLGNFIYELRENVWLDRWQWDFNYQFHIVPLLDEVWCLGKHSLELNAAAVFM